MSIQGLEIASQRVGFLVGSAVLICILLRKQSGSRLAAFTTSGTR